MQSVVTHYRRQGVCNLGRFAVSTDVAYVLRACGWRADNFRKVLRLTQRSNAKIQRHFRFSSPRTLQEFEEKTCKTFVGKCYKNSTVRENYKLGVSEDVH